MGYRWSGCFFALSLVAIPAFSAVDTITLDELFESYLYMAEYRNFDGWENLVGGDITDALIFYHDLFPNDPPPVYTNKFLLVTDDVGNITCRFNTIPFEIYAEPAYVVDLGRRQSIDSFHDVFPDGAWKSTECVWDGWHIFLREFFRQSWERHGLRAAQPFIEALDNEIPDGALTWQEYNRNNFQISIALVDVEQWPEVAPYWNSLPGSFSLSVRPFSVTTACLAPAYPSPFWADWLREPSVMLSPSDFQYFISEVASIWGVNESDFQSSQTAIVAPWGNWENWLTFNLTLLVKGRNDIHN